MFVYGRFWHRSNTCSTAGSLEPVRIRTQLRVAAAERISFWLADQKDLRSWREAENNSVMQLAAARRQETLATDLKESSSCEHTPVSNP